MKVSQQAGASLPAGDVPLARTPGLKQADQGAHPVYRKMALRILPFIIICYFFAYLDRVNVAFAKLQMSQALSLSDAVYGFGAGIFFIGYLIFEIPSNLIMMRVGARRWLARIMFTWGIISAAMMFVTTPTQFYVLRFLLGVAEAGFFPGVLLYLSQWFPAAQRGRIVAILMAAAPLSGIIGGPVSGLLLERMQGVGGLDGWQWMFLIEGLPVLFLGLACLVLLTDQVKDAKWLDAQERAYVLRQLEEENGRKQTHSFREALASVRLWQLAMIYFCIGMGTLGLAFWLPTLLKEAGVASVESIGWLSAIPSLAAVIAMVLVGRSADARRERRLHLALPMLVGALALVATPFVSGVPMTVLTLTIATAGLTTALPMFWPMPSAILGGTAMAGGLALLNSAGALAGFIGPFAIGWLKGWMTQPSASLFVVAAVVVVGALVVLSLPRHEVNH